LTHLLRREWPNVGVNVILRVPAIAVFWAARS
jgi:hypothetical protein